MYKSKYLPRDEVNRREVCECDGWVCDLIHNKGEFVSIWKKKDGKKEIDPEGSRNQSMKIHVNLPWMRTWCLDWMKSSWTVQMKSTTFDVNPINFSSWAILRLSSCCQWVSLLGFLEEWFLKSCTPLSSSLVTSVWECQFWLEVLRTCLVLRNSGHALNPDVPQRQGLARTQNKHNAGRPSLLL
jgi:hypothetical protein